MRELTEKEKLEYNALTKDAKQMSLFNIEETQSKNVYGYCRISRKTQSIERQIRNIKSDYPNAVIIEEAYTGTKMDRPKWLNLLKTIKRGDTIIFDSVSRMSRNAEEGIATYFELYEKGISLVFLKEGYINTALFEKAANSDIPSTGHQIADIYIEATNKVIRIIAEDQIKEAFRQSEKEVMDLHTRTKEGMLTAKLNGKQIGRKTGIKVETKKSIEAKKEILKYSKSFEGTLSDKDVIRLLKISRNSYYKYKKELTLGC